MHSMTRFLVGVALAVALGLHAGRAAACGGGGVTTVTEGGVVADAQRIVLSLRDQDTPNARTEIVAQIGVPKTSGDYGVLIPTPVVPVLDAEPISAADLDELDRVTRPTITRREPESESGGFSCGCGAMDGAGESKSSAVNVSAPVEVGPVTAVVLQADDSAALSAWLGENGFHIPDDQSALVARYVRPGGAFIAVRRNDRAATNAPSSIGLHYTLPGDYRVVSLAFARLGAAPTVSFTVFVSAPRTAEASGAFVNLTLDDLDDRLLAASYSKAVASAVAAERYAFVLERALSMVYRSPSGLRLAGGSFSPHFEALFDFGVVTRASTIMTANTLDMDATFAERVEQQVPGSRSIGEPESSRGAGVGLLGLVGLARALRRRGKRRSAARRR